MAFTYALDPTTPAGGEAAALGDDRIREFKNAMVERLQQLVSDYTVDPYKLKSGLEAAGTLNVRALTPVADNTYAIGTSLLRFSDLRAVTATFSSNITQSAGTAALQAVTGTTAVFSSTGQFAGLTVTTLTGTGVIAGFTDQTNSGNFQALRVRARTANAAEEAFGAYVTGDAQIRLSIDSNGLMVWGTGALAGDTNLYRSAANTLKTDDAFVIGGSLTANGDILQASGYVISNVGPLFLRAGTTINIGDVGASIVNLAAGGGAMAFGASVTLSNAGALSGITTVLTSSHASIGGYLAIITNEDGGNSSVWKNTAHGLVMQGGVGTSNGLLLAGAGGSTLLRNPNGTTDMVVNGAWSGFTTLAGTGAVSGFTSLALSAGITATTATFTGALSTTASLAIAAGQKFYFDGVAATGDTYIYENSANILWLSVGGTIVAFTSTAITLPLTLTGVTSLVMVGPISGVSSLAMAGALTGVTTLVTSSTATIAGGFGCNTKAAQVAYASGGALNAYVTGVFGLNSDANMSLLHAMVVSIRAALVANGIMS